MFGWLSRKRREQEEARRRSQRAALPAPSSYRPEPLLDPTNVLSPLSPFNPVYSAPDPTPSPSYHSDPSPSYSSGSDSGYSSGGFDSGSSGGGDSGGGGGW